ncbi:MAG TPA: family 20 glycosylhydrolase [Candidatus Sulfopaludibacter sp.]|nr:family 20 glycosylhydrolase [Candidatus Sulfopaludibacter sp.]
MPRVATPGDGKLAITGDFTVAAPGIADSRMDSAVDRLLTRLWRQTGIWMVAPKAADPARATLRIECAAPGPNYPTLREDEAYTLDVTPRGAVVKAATIDGAMHGMATFLQLVGRDAEGFSAAAIHVEDRPRFAWRGLMLDVSRHWLPVEVVKRNLEAMAAVKLNVFHWHLSDDQGFRVESKLFPKLQQKGSDGLFYTQEQIRDVVNYARDRGIRVVPEFDMPGHTSSWLPGYPEIAASPGPYEIGRHFGIFDPVLDPTKEATYTFLEGFLGEMTKLFPDPYFHIGGDEVNGKEWTQSASIKAFKAEHKLADNDALQAYFNQRVLKILEKNGKTMIGWDEILHPDLPKASVIQSWRGQKGLAEATSKGYQGILSWGYYLDHLSPASFHYAIDPLAGDPTPEQASRVLGGEACMWAELVSSETVDSRVWPRTAAIAERFWSPAEVKDVDSMYTRMAAVSRQLDWSGVQHRANYGPMLDRLAGSDPVGPVRVLADASEALGLGPRRGGRYTTLMPLNRFVDAARPESESVRALEVAARRAAPDDLASLRRQFTAWAANDARFQPLAGQNAMLAELKPLSKDLSELGNIGLKALDYLAAGKSAPADWLAAQSAEITRIQKPDAEVTLAAFRPVKILLDSLKK